MHQQIPFLADLRGEYPEYLYMGYSRKLRNSILYTTYHFFEGKNAVYFFLRFGGMLMRKSSTYNWVFMAQSRLCREMQRCGDFAKQGRSLS